MFNILFYIVKRNQKDSVSYNKPYSLTTIVNSTHVIDFLSGKQSGQQKKKIASKFYTKHASKNTTKTLVHKNVGFINVLFK